MSAEAEPLPPHVRTAEAVGREKIVARLHQIRELLGRITEDLELNQGEYEELIRRQQDLVSEYERLRLKLSVLDGTS